MILSFWKQLSTRRSVSDTYAELLNCHENKCQEVTNILSIFQRQTQSGYRFDQVKKTANGLIVLVFINSVERLNASYEVVLYIPSLQEEPLFYLAAQMRHSSSLYPVMSINTFSINKLAAGLGLEQLGLQYTINHVRQFRNTILQLDLKRTDEPSFHEFIGDTLHNLGFKVLYRTSISLLAEKEVETYGEQVLETSMNTPGQHCKLFSLLVGSPHHNQEFLIMYTKLRRRRKYSIKTY